MQMLNRKTETLACFPARFLDMACNSQMLTKERHS